MWFLVVVLLNTPGVANDVEVHRLIPVPTSSQSICEAGAEAVLPYMTPPPPQRFKKWYCVWRPTP